jgi:hypothetical protein
MMAVKQNALAINLAITALGSGNIIDPENYYWTSSITGSNLPVAINGSYYTYGNLWWDNSCYVRAIRKF